ELAMARYPSRGIIPGNIPGSIPGSIPLVVGGAGALGTDRGPRAFREEPRESLLDRPLVVEPRLPARYPQPDGRTWRNVRRPVDPPGMAFHLDEAPRAEAGDAHEDPARRAKVEVRRVEALGAAVPAHPARLDARFEPEREQLRRDDRFEPGRRDREHLRIHFPLRHSGHVSGSA